MSEGQTSQERARAALSAADQYVPVKPMSKDLSDAITRAVRSERYGERNGTARCAEASGLVSFIHPLGSADNEGCDAEI